MSAQSEEAKRTLRESEDPPALALAAQVLAASARPEDHGALLDFLRSEEFRGRLDPPSEPRTSPEDRWIAKPLFTLEENRAPSAHAALAALMGDPAFNADLDCTDLLVEVSASMRPPSPSVIAFWRRYTSTDSPHLHPIMRVLLENGDPLAVAEFEGLLLAAAPGPDEDDYRLDWLRRWVLRHRDSPHVLAMVERLVAVPRPPLWTPEMQLVAAEVVFMHKRSWFRLNQMVLPPPLGQTPPEGRATLRRIADLVHARLQAGEALKEAMAATLAQLNELRDASSPPDAR